jgi:hypothetical protein
VQNFLQGVYGSVLELLVQKSQSFPRVIALSWYFLRQARMVLDEMSVRARVAL